MVDKKRSDSMKNPWFISTIILGVLVIVIIAMGGFSSSGIGENAAGQKVLDFAIRQGASASLVSVSDNGALYEVVLSIEGENVPVYVTKDGNNLIPSLIPLSDDGSGGATENAQRPSPSSNAPKSDKPVVELFVMSHCPYGTQTEKGILPVASLLGDKIDFKVKFVYYAMHGEVEVYEQLNQYCIQEEQNNKYLNYLTCFLEDGNSERCLGAVGINRAALSSCTAAADTKFDVTKNFEDKSSYLSGRYVLFDIFKADNEKYDVGGSPTLIINGAESQSGRDSASLLGTICAAFNDAPEECNTQFQAGSPSPGFGYGTSETANNAAANCGY
ncbi:MAG: hypothetical protein NUV97_02320 [archaeon]|nr:hypothetical protein [archaeon]MCR4323782.1 hypothetical protein [Nanoarchaeota archaeon]